MSVELAGLRAGDDPEAWRRLGFDVSADGRCRVGGVWIELAGSGGGIAGWVLAGEQGPPAIDGLTTAWEPLAPAAPGAHPNGASAIDHVVVFTGDRDRTVAAMVAAGGDERRRAGPPQVPVAMAFVRFGTTIVEVAESPQAPAGAAAFWGLVAVVPDVDALAEQLGGDLVGTPRAAVQPGRRIATARPAPGLEVALAFMTPRPMR